MTNKKIKLLIIGTTFSINGGVQNYLYNLIKQIDKKQFEVTYGAIHSENVELSYINEYKKIGVHCLIFPMNKRKKITIYYKFLKNNYFDIIHVNLTSGSFVVFGIIARLISKAKVIFHSHTYIPFKKLNFREKAIQKLYKFFGDYFLSCSKAAGEYMFGSNIVESNLFYIAKNSISRDRFSFSLSSRSKIRHEYNIDNIVLYGYVGRVSKEKNIPFIVRVFNEIQKIQENAILMIVGGGPLLDDMKEYVITLGLSNKVIFTGPQVNIHEYMCAFDLLLLASLYESLGIVLVEAQACGLNCIVSDGVLEDSNLTPLWHQMNSTSNEYQWALSAINYANHDHSDYWYLLEQEGYSVEESVKLLQNIYLKILNL